MIPPGPGTWKRDAAHFPRRASPIAAHLYETAFSQGFAEGCDRYGMTLETLQYRSVDGWMYNQPRPLGAPAGSAPPPAPILWLLTRLHPGYRDRARKGGDPATRLAEDTARWTEVERPERIRVHRALLAERLDGLDGAGLADHLTRCVAAYADSVHCHGRLTIAANIGVGLFVDHVGSTLGVEAPEVLRALHGDSPVSAGDEPCARAAVDALRRDADARAILDRADVDPGRTLASLRDAPGEVGAAVAAWLDTVGQRTLDVYDVLQPRSLEVPFVLVEALRAAVAEDRRAVERSRAVDTLRERAPDRPAFDRLLALARQSLALRDERVLYNDYWSAGVTRRALLAAGEHLVRAGRLQAAEHALVGTLDELLALLGGAGAADLGARWERYRTEPPPPDAFGPPEPPVPDHLFPEPLRANLRATLVCLRLSFDEREDALEDGVVRGFGASEGVAEGVARVVLGPDDFDRIEPGDIVVAPSTSPTWNVVLPRIAALVTDRGGVLCHAAIVSREFGIPAVVGARTATRRLVDGARVRVDGASGEVRVLRGAP